MANRVTIQDIADALGVSRNTVSKAINNTGILADATREKVLNKAAEMGYKQFSYINIADLHQADCPQPQKVREIALFTAAFPGASHFASSMLDKFQKECSQLGYRLMIHCIRDTELDSLELPPLFDSENTAGILCIEMFDYAYSQMLCDLNIPILFVDGPVAGLRPPLRADLLLMDNQASIYSFIKEMANRGKKSIGFVGEILHCQSFYERYMAYCNGLYMAGLPRVEKYCFVKHREDAVYPSPEDYGAFLLSSFQKLDELPEVLICANDFVAIDVLNALRKLDISVPRDIYLCGFDDAPESRILSPSLTTIHIHSQIMGFSAVHLLISRIQEPSLQFRTIHTETDLIYRESTED